jgi:signal transduction histidine kinase
VTDRGIGIPAADQAQVFDRFYRAGNVNPLQTSGFGLGLYVTRAIVEQHGGTITVESVEGQGSTFTLCLPLARSEEPSPTA